MTDDNTLGPELLKHNGVSSPERLEGEWRELERLLEADRRRAGVVKWLAAGLLALGAISFVVFIALSTTVFVEYAPPPVSFLAEFVTEGLPIIGAWSLGLGIAVGLLWFLLSRMVDTRAMKVRLASIELQLRSDGNGES